MLRKRLPLLGSTGLWWLIACSPEIRPSDGGFGSGAAEGGSDGASADGANEADEAEADGSAEHGDADGSEADDDGPDIKLDVGSIDPDAPGEDGCTAVDLLFVIDNSASMTSYQQGLVAAFPSFVDAMNEALPPETDLHVGITTSSFCDFGANPSHGESNCVANETVDVMRTAYVTPDQGTVPTPGFQGRLRPHDGKHYFAATVGDPQSMGDLKTWFSTNAAVGSSGCSFEFNASAAAYAFHPANAGANDGFLRDEGAVLLIFVLSDEADQSFDVDDATALHDLVSTAKAGCGGDHCIVGGGLFSEWCTPAQNAAFDFLASFGSEPVWGSIGSPFGDAPDYGSVVGEALAQVVAQTCETIPPAG